MNKKELILGFLGAILVIILMVFFGLQYKSNVSNLNNAIKLPSPAISKDKITLSLSEVQKHNSQTDCWVIVNNNVYDVTQYINLHPGGSTTIYSYCGQDMTQEFLTKGGQGSHSSLADKQHSLMLLGPLNGQITNSSVTNNQNLQNSLKQLKNDNSFDDKKEEEDDD